MRPLVERFFEKSGDSMLYDTTYRHVMEDGFATWNIIDGAIVVVQAMGDGPFWFDFFTKMGRDLGMNIRFSTTRNPRAWSRKYGAKVIGHVMEIEVPPWVE